MTWAQVCNMACLAITHLKSAMKIYPGFDISSLTGSPELEDGFWVSGFACTGSLWLDALSWLSLHSELPEQLEASDLFS